MLNSVGEGFIIMPDYFIDLTNENETTVNLTSIGKPFLTGYDWDSQNSTVTIFFILRRVLK